MCKDYRMRIFLLSGEREQISPLTFLNFLSKKFAVIENCFVHIFSFESASVSFCTPN
jgi:hypothetical protein